MDAEKKDVWITYPSGKSKHYSRWLSNPKVLDGSVITIGTKEETEPINKTEFAKEVSSIIADFLQIYITLVLLWNTANTA